MAKYAQIIGQNVHGVFEYDPLPEFAPNIIMLQIPEDSPVQAGWGYVDGEYIEPPEPELYVPNEVTMRQARMALHFAGILKAADSAVAAMEGEAGEIARIEWEFSSTVRRDRQFVQNIGSALGLSSEDIDNLFIAAEAL